jgi:hypothetical protein
VKSAPKKTYDFAIGKAVRNMHGQNPDCMRILFITVYELIENAKPFTDFPLHLEIQGEKGLVIGEITKLTNMSR